MIAAPDDGCADGCATAPQPSLLGLAMVARNHRETKAATERNRPATVHATVSATASGALYRSPEHGCTPSTPSLHVLPD